MTNGQDGTVDRWFDQHPSVMLVIDPDDGHIVEANHAAVRFYGWTREQLRTMRISQINVLDDDEIAAELRRAKLEQRAEFVFRHRTADGRERDVEVSSGPVEINGRALLHSVIHDATERYRTLAALRASEEFAARVVDHAPLGVVVAEPGGAIVRVNRALCEITGHGEDALVGRELHDLTHPEDRAQLHAAVAQLRSGEVTSYRRAVRLQRGDGGLAHVEVEGTLLHDGQGRPEHLLEVVHDVTEREQAVAWAEAAAERAEEAAQRLTETMESVTDGILLLDRDFTVTYVNQRFEAIIGRTREQVVGRGLWSLFPEAVGSGFDVAYHRALEEGSTQSVLDYYAPIDRWLEAHAYPSSQGLAVYFRDVSDRVEHETTLQRIAESERADAERLRQLDEAKNAFLSAVSHELRTPLTIVRGMAETLVERRELLDVAARSRFEDAVLAHARELGDLLDDLLQVDRLSRGVLSAERRRLDAAEVVRGVVHRSAVAPRAVVEAPETLPAVLDRVQLEHLVANLLTNAEKYAPDGPVEVRVAAVDDQGVRLEVRDHGPGLPEPLHTRVFEPFVRVDDDHPKPGTGVGLALVAEFAKLHGGRAWVESPEGGGARFVVELAGPEADPQA